MKVLIVEDEILTREGLRMSVPWEKLGITEVFTAEDGEEGIEIASAREPDIIMTDVRMPRMDGITMAFEIRKTNKKCRFIFISSYSDKEYLKSAIKLSVVNYIEKPVEIDEIVSALKIAVCQVAEQQRRDAMEEEYRKQFAGVAEELPEDDLIPASWQSSMHTADKIEKYIEDNFGDCNLSLTLLEDQFHLSKQYMCWLFKKEKSKTINQCIIQTRLSWAKKFMHRNPTAKIKDVAARAGFSDSNYFIKIFKKYEQVTPADYMHGDCRHEEYRHGNCQHEEYRYEDCRHEDCRHEDYRQEDCIHRGKTC